VYGSSLGAGDGRCQRWDSCCAQGSTRSTPAVFSAGSRDQGQVGAAVGECGRRDAIRERTEGPEALNLVAACWTVQARSNGRMLT
jgi:hypothetical protein